MSSQLNTLKTIVLELRRETKMAESGQSDSNKIFPANTQKINETNEWKQERTRMISHISEAIVKEMSDEQKENYVRSCIVERYYYAPDHEVVDKYQTLDGEWTDNLEEYRPQPKSQIRMSGTMRDEMRLTK